MIQWVLALLLVPGLQLFPKERPLNPSYGILKRLDPYFKICSERMVEVTILEQNWLTSTKAKCSSALDHIFGNCLYINNMENDSKALKNVSSLSEFHLFSYVLIRRFLEIIFLYLSRWLPLGSIVGFLSSSCALIWIYLHNKWQFKRLTNATKVLSKNWLLILLSFLCSTAVFLSVLVPFSAEIVTGGIIESQLGGIFTDVGGFSIRKVFHQNNSCSTVYDFFYFQCLRKTLFDMEKSEIRRSVPMNTEERLLLQMRLSLMTVITCIGFIIMYLSIVLTFCMIPRMLIIHLKNKFFSGTKEPPVKSKKKSSLWDSVFLPRDELDLEYCYKKVLNPGIKKPWQELDFTTTIEPSNKRKKMKKSRDHRSKDENHGGLSRSSIEYKDKETSTEEKQNNADSNRASIAKRKKDTHSTDEKQVGLSRTSIELKDNDTSTDEKQNNPDSSKVSIDKRMKGSHSTDEKQEGLSRSLIENKDNAKSTEEKQNNPDSNKSSIAKRRKGIHSTDEKQIDLLRLFLQRNENKKPTEEKRIHSDSNRAFIEKSEEKQPNRNSSKVSLKNSELRKPRPNIGHLHSPTVNNTQKTGDKISKTKYVSVGTYACLDSQNNSDDSDFVFLDH